VLKENRVSGEKVVATDIDDSALDDTLDTMEQHGERIQQTAMP
jgi:hypothetical protein